MADGGLSRAELEGRVEQLTRLVLALADKLATVAEHLGRLSERKELRDGGHRPGNHRDLRGV